MKTKHVSYPRTDSVNSKSAKLVELARALASELPEFQRVKGPGEGGRATIWFMAALRKRAVEEFRNDYSECQMCGDTALAADFYFPDERTIVEVALGLPNPKSEFEKDILKALMARDHGHEVDRLLFISRAGAAKKCSQPGRLATAKWAQSKHGLVVEIHELPGEPRKRRRGPRAR